MLNNISRLCSKWLNPTLLPAGPHHGADLASPRGRALQQARQSCLVHLLVRPANSANVCAVSVNDWAVGLLGQLGSVVASDGILICGTRGFGKAVRR
jgi:hypothetical protein